MIKEIFVNVVEAIEDQWAAKIAVIFFFLLSLWWIYLNFFANDPDNSQKQLFAATYGLMALWGAVWGLIISRRWGGFYSVMGRAIIFFSFGLFAQEFGQLAYSYYIYFLQIEVPYPSIGDMGYFSSIIFYTLGVLFLAKASGVKISFKSVSHVMQAVIIPLILLAASYFVFLSDYEFDWTQPLKIFLDFGYPFGQAIYISLAFVTYLLSRKVLGGMMRSRILFILFALLVQYIADYSFLYLSNKGLWKVGELNDYTYLIAYLFMGLALFQLKSVIKFLTK